MQVDNVIHMIHSSELEKYLHLADEHMQCMTLLE